MNFCSIRISRIFTLILHVIEHNLINQRMEDDAVLLAGVSLGPFLWLGVSNRMFRWETGRATWQRYVSSG